jgi:hypothetical protein
MQELHRGPRRRYFGGEGNLKDNWTGEEISALVFARV